METAREILSKAEGKMTLQGNVDPYVLRYGDEDMVRQAVRLAIDEAGGPGRRGAFSPARKHVRHILNLGHGVLQGTPEDFTRKLKMF